MNKVSIIIPVYNALYYLDICLKSLYDFYESELISEIFLVDDCSDDNIKIINLIEKYSGLNIKLIRNSSNIGYTKTVNIGIRKSNPKNDIVLLNSDTRLTKSWLKNIMISVYKKKKFGIASPLSNNAGFFSFPLENKDNYEFFQNKISMDNYAKKILSKSKIIKNPILHTANGFCMYVKRTVINTIGLFDEISFPYGYGEENDFCMRAYKKFFYSIISTSSYVFHFKTKSFDPLLRINLINSAQEILKKKHPEYFILSKKYLNSQRIKALRKIQISNT